MQLEPSHIIALILDNGHYEGKYLSGHPLIVTYLRENQTPIFHIETIDGLDCVRLWSSEGWAREIEKRLHIPQTKVTVNPLILELRKAIEEERFMDALNIKKQMNALVTPL